MTTYQLTIIKDELSTALYMWTVGYIGFNGPLRQYCSLYRASSERGGERSEKW